MAVSVDFEAKVVGERLDGPVRALADVGGGIVVLGDDEPDVVAAACAEDLWSRVRGRRGSAGG